MTDEVPAEVVGAAQAAAGRRGGLVSGLTAALPVTLGLGLLGVSAYVYLLAAARDLGPVEFAPVSLAWTVVFTAGAGLLVPFEQETGRLVAGRRARGDGAAPVAKVALATAGVLVLVLGAVILLGQRLWADLLFRGDVGMLLAAAAAAAVLAVVYVSRGLLGGNGRFRRYGTQLGLEGLVRGAGAITLVLVGASAASYVWLLAVAPLLAVLLTPPRRRDLAPGSPVAVRPFVGHLGTLVATAAISGAMMNAGPILVELLSPGGAAPGIFLAALVLARAPLFLFAAVQAVALPRLTAARAAGRREFGRALRLISTLVAALGAAGVVVFGVLGPELTRLSFGPEYRVERLITLMLAGSAGAFMLALLFSQALVALGRHRTTTVSWAVGAATMLVVTVLVPDLEVRVAGGMLAGGVAATGCLFWYLRMESR